MATPTATALFHRTPWTPPLAVKAKGMYIQREDGVQLLDAVGGAAVTSIGHGNKKVIQAIKDQSDELSYVYNMQMSNAPAEALAKRLIDISKGAFARCAFVCGGSEAMEGVMKTARQYFYESGQHQRVNFIARKLSFHGNTLSTLALAYHPTRRLPYADILDSKHFHHVSPAYAKRFQKPDETEEQYVERLRQELEEKFLELGPDTVIGFVAETVVGATSGVVPPPKGYLKAMKSVCHKYGALFILDEVMSGSGRMGSTFHAWEAYEGMDAKPDIQAIAKGLGGGYVSIGAVLMSQKVVDGMGVFWKHGHTYQAQPTACAAALAVQDVIASGNLLENIEIQGAYLGQLLRERLLAPGSVAAPYVFDIRGNGGFWAIEFDRSDLAMPMQRCAFEKGLIIMGMTGGSSIDGKIGSHLILAPAYIATKDDIEKIVDLTVRSIEEVIKAL
ncbi:PLP-dependent transferase [Fistulina hepatica ATCC 64428]|uniref:PLP-dependent transferase n=1 Tax=Fistulina hepatica ATCC 64428 TaxID=1128425 RepID=A0A0D7A6X4_9AGAR|nr:PLP-dependent transferase [Fistulina hepatica ATCC 64428]